MGNASAALLRARQCACAAMCVCASLVPCLGTNARLGCARPCAKRIGAAQGRDTKTGAQGGEKAHHLLHTGYKKVDVYTFEK